MFILPNNIDIVVVDKFICEFDHFRLKIYFVKYIDNIFLLQKSVEQHPKIILHSMGKLYHRLMLHLFF